MFPELELREGWATVVLLLLILICVAWSLQSADWTYGLGILPAVVVVGGVAGIVLAKSRTPSRLAHLLSCLAGLTWAAFLTSRMLSRATGLPMEAAVIELDEQVRAWFAVLFSGETSPGNFVFLLLLSMLLWLVAYVSAWAIFRWHRVWLGVILCGVALMLNVTYAPTNLTGYLILFILFALLLVVRTSLAFYQMEWKDARVGYGPELVYSFLRAGLIIAVVGILLAWVAPAALASRPMKEVWDKAAAPWRQLQDQTARLFHDLNYRNEPAFITFTRSMKFGGAVALTDAPVMDVQAATGRYWRVMVFHDYTGDGWTNTDPSQLLLDANEPRLEAPDLQMRREVTQTINLRQNLGPQGTIAAAAQPLRSELPLQVVTGHVTHPEEAIEDSEIAPLPSLAGDPSVLYSRRPLSAGDAYRVVSSLTIADEHSLRGAGDDYPDWVVPHYLRLPDSLPERVSLLAEQITAEEETPYDKAAAIEGYLRDIPYNEEIEGPAEGQDGVDYFLFDAKEGYCDYYSSAMVVMLRSVGVPARYVRGYSQGFKDEGSFRILEKDGHAWVEVFFPDYGWVEFEPTAGEPVLLRPRYNDEEAEGIDDRNRLSALRQRDQMDDGSVPSDRFDASQEMESRTLLQRAGWVGGLALALVVLSLGVAAVLLVRRRRRAEGLNLAERVYGDLVDWVRRLLGLSPLAHQTPNEYGNAVVQVLPAGRQPVERIVDTYVAYRFGGQVADAPEVEEAWRDTRRALSLRWLQRRGEVLMSLPRRLLPFAPRGPRR
jgi:transglutaminase-like putative cysteine protease